MAVKPADRLLFVIALAALGICLIVRLVTPRGGEAPAGPESLSLAIYVTGENGFKAEDLETLIAGYPYGSRKPSGPGYVLGQDAGDPPVQDGRGNNGDDGNGGDSDVRISVSINAEDNNPDILIAGGQSLAGAIAAGLYLPLDRYYHAESSPFQAAGKWALPLVSAMDVLIYNIPLLREAGFDRPPRTRDDFLVYAQAIKALNERNRTPDMRYSLSLGLSPLDPRGLNRDIYPWFYASGLLLPDGPEFGGQDYTKTLEFLSTLNRGGLIAPGSFNATGAERVEDFIRGTAAMMIVSSRDLRYIREKMGSDAVGITLIPHAGAYTGRPVLGLSTWYAGISAESPHPDESWALLQYLREQSAFLAESLALVPGNGSYGPYISVDPLLDKAWNLYEAAELVPDVFLSPGAPEDQDGIFRRELNRLFQSPISAEESAQAIRQALEQRGNPRAYP
jgi:ABC-type glycerol-3-phosphate transport system substrate-binding protein